MFKNDCGSVIVCIKERGIYIELEERLEAYFNMYTSISFQKYKKKNYDPKVMPFYGRRRVEIMNKWYR